MAGVENSAQGPWPGLPADDLGAAFALLREHLRRYLQRRVCDPTQADDLVQDVFVKALASQQRGQRIGNLTGWLYAAARHALADHYRARGETEVHWDDELTEAVAAADAHGGDGTTLEVREHQALAQCLRPMIEQLPPRYRDTLLGAEIEGRTLRAMAQDEGVSTSALKSRAARGRAMLKARVLTCCEVEASGGWVQATARRQGGCDSECSGRGICGDGGGS